MYEFLLHEPLVNKSKHNHEDHSHEHHHADARSVDKKILKNFSFDDFFNDAGSIYILFTF